MPIKGNNTALPTTCQLVDMASHSQTWLAERNTYQWASLQRVWGTWWSWEGLALPTSFHPLPYHWVPDLCERRERGREWGRKEEEGREGGRRPQMISLWKHASVEIITIRVPVSSPRDASMSFKSSWSMKPSLFWSIMLNACVGWNRGWTSNEPYLPLKMCLLVWCPIELPTARRIHHVIHIHLHTLIAMWESLSFKHWWPLHGWNINYAYRGQALVQ